MSAPDTDLFPEDLLEAALAPERPDPDDFAAGVHERVERAATDAADPAPRAWPTWLKRAAAILPPGVIDVALLGKFSGVAGGTAKSASGFAWFAAPWAILLVAAASVVGAMRLTAKLDAGRSSGLDERGRARLLRRAPAAVYSLVLFLAPLGLLLAAALRGEWFLVAAVFLLFASAVVAIALSLSRAGVADRRTVGKVVNAGLGQFLGIGLMLPVFLRDTMGPLSLYGLPALLVVAVLASGYFADESRHRGLKLKLTAPLVLAVAVLLPLVTRVTVERPFGAEVEELEAWIEDFAFPPGDLSDWEALGHARAALGPERFDALDLRRARAALAALPPGDLHPKTAVGAWRAGLLADADLVGHRRTALLLRNDLRDGVVRSHLRDSDLLELLALRADGTLARESTDAFVAGLERALPEAGERSALERMRAAVDGAAVLGLDGFVEREADRIRAILRAAWSAEGSSYAMPGGFGNLVEGQDTGGPHIHPDTTDALIAVELMAAVGVPEGIDLAQVERYLYSEAMVSVSGQPLIGDVEAALGRWHLRRAFTLPEPTAIHWLRRDAIFFAALVMVGLSLWVVWRAPHPTAIEDGPLADA